MSDEVATVAAEGVSQEMPQQTGETTARIPEGYVPKDQAERDVSNVRRIEQQNAANAQRQYQEQVSLLNQQVQAANARLEELAYRSEMSGLDEDERTVAENNLLKQKIQSLQVEKTDTIARLNMQAALAHYVGQGIPGEELDTSSPQAMDRSAKKYLRDQERDKELKDAIAALKAQVPQQIQKVKAEAVRETRESLGVDAVELGGPTGAPLTSIEEIEKKLVDAQARAKAGKPKPGEITGLSRQLAQARRAQQ